MASKRPEIRLTMKHEGTPGVTWGGVRLSEATAKALEELGERLTSPAQVEALNAIAQEAGIQVKVPEAVRQWLAGEGARVQGDEAVQAFRLKHYSGAMAKRLKAHKAPERKAVAAMALRPNALYIASRGDDAPAKVIDAALLSHHRRPLAQVSIVCPASRTHLWKAAIAAQAGDAAALFTTLEPSEVYNARKKLAEITPHLIVVDEAHRLASGGRLLDGLRGAAAEQIIAVSAVTPTEDPASAYAWLSLMAPDLAGPRRAWWWGRFCRPESTDDDTRADLNGRFARLRIDGDRAPGDATLHIPLTGQQRRHYDDIEAQLCAHFSDPGPLGPDAAQEAATLAHDLLAVCASASLVGARKAWSSKLTELLSITAAEVGGRGQLVVIFTAFDPMGKAIAQALTAAQLSASRFHARLSKKRRAAVVERFQSGGPGQVLVVSAPERLEAVIDANLVVHFDAPWSAGALAARQERVNAAETISLVAAQTIEAHLPLISAEEEGDEALWQPSADALMKGDVGATRLRQLFTADLPAEASPEEAEPTEENIPLEAAPEEAKPTEENIPLEAAPEEAAPTEENIPPAGAASSVDDDGLPPEATAYADANSDAEREAWRPEPSEAAMQAPETPLLSFLDTVEAPLKAVNRLVAGLPWVGEPVSEVAGLLWQQLNAAAGRK